MESTGKTALVIGGGPAGIEAAVKIGQAGHDVILVERESVLGGRLNLLAGTFPRNEDTSAMLANSLRLIEESGKVVVKTGTTVVGGQRDGEGFRVSLKQTADDTVADVNVDAVVIATGFDYFDLSAYGEYGYGTYNGVVSAVEFEGMLKGWRQLGYRQNIPKAIAFFKCVGSRDRSKGYPYCSKICCMYTAKQAAMVKELSPTTACYVFYMDIRAAGKGYEEFVRRAIEDKKVRYVRGRPAKVIPDAGRLLIRAEDTLMGNPIEIRVDMIVLAGAAVARKETVELAKMFGAKTDEYGFLEDDGMSPVRSADRVFFAGGSGFPVDIPGAREQGAAAAAEVIALFSR
ncbi:MAG: CoB--CoM heterodisulfide reductase iron-sulfur subunit A family protein [Syntrophothermus sp.]|uniref:FAD-dependent oxidoreductase n=1 Tax=Syntrophothermus sp. TaxID=2736299 RepID=UPI00257E7AA9|nr:FAD-dependent oxidoreductase [Syntrophothermus sp.]NSW83865.1 CoB--CoM heterodisulfide reductase iron-sulfur subunit A family protein [Syntrophothermus sp.]